MKLNRKGFAITAILYGLLLLFVMLVSSYLLVLSAKKNRLDNLVKNAEERHFHPENFNGNGGDVISDSGEPSSTTKYTITFYANGGKFTGMGLVTSVTRTVDEGTLFSEVDVPGITKNGESFEGWYTNSTGGTKIGDNTSIDSNLNLYAHWFNDNVVVDEYVTVTFNPNGGTVSETTREVRKGSAIGSLPTPTRTNCTYDGWSNSPDEDGREVTATTTVSANTTIYAHWAGCRTSNTATITFDPNGGTVSETTREVEINSAIGELPIPTRSNYSFTGWYVAQSNQGRAISASTIVTENKTYYAHWTEEPIKITVEKFVDGSSAGYVVNNLTVTNGTWGPTTVVGPRYGYYISTECSPSNVTIDGHEKVNTTTYSADAIITISGITSTTYCRVNFES